MQQLLATLQQRIPEWKDKPIRATPLSGGMTNRNFTVTVGEESFVLRLCAPGAAIHGIDRSNERRCVRICAGAGIAPPLVAVFDDLPDADTIMISRFVAGRTLDSAEVSHPDHFAQVADLLRRTHQLTDFAGRFDVFEIFNNGLAFARSRLAALPSFINQVEHETNRIRRAFAASPATLVPCHNDLLPTNLLRADTGRLWLLDWEYAGWGDPFFDLGNLSVNNLFDDAQDQALLTHYFGELTEQAWARLKLMKIASDAREGIWGAVQSLISSLDVVDYEEYAIRHLARVMNQCASPAVAEWIKVMEQ